MTRTRREIDWRLRTIAKRERARLSFEAKLHDKIIEGAPASERSEPEFSEEADAVLSAALAEAQARKRREFEHGNRPRN